MNRLRLLAPAATAAVATACTAGAGTVMPGTAAETRGLAALRAQLSGPVAESPVFSDGVGHNVAIAVMQQRSDPAVPEVDIYRWHRGWQSLARVTLDVGGSVASDNGASHGGAATTPIRIADLTPAKAPELVVTVHYNAGPATAVLSTFGGRWHALTYHGGLTEDGDERFDVQVRSGGDVASRENDCVPDCADGHAVTTVYRFVPSTGRLEAYTNR